MLNRLAIILAFIIVVILFALPVAAAPPAQTTLPDFTLNAQTVISVTVAITGGQVIVVPVDLTFIAENDNGETDVSVIADVEQQAGIFIGVAPSRVTTANIQLPGTTASNASPAASSTPIARPANQTGTHVANRNSNLRAGPGTNFGIVGRVASGDTVNVVGQNADGTWLQLDDGNWIAEFLVDPVETNNQENESADEEPDATATPEATVTPDATDAEGDTEANSTILTTYLQEITTIGAGASDAVDILNDLMQDPQPASTDWRNEIANQLGVLSGALDQYLALTPVPGYENISSQVTDVAFACEQAADYLASGLQNPLSIDTDLAIESVQYCASQANSLAAAVQALQ